jgi:AdoMet-dependent heme synthase
LGYIVIIMSINQGFDFFIQWHLTERCNLRCSHCYQTGGAIAELTFPEVRRVIGDVSDMLKIWSEDYGIRFAPSFNVTGGEPFLRGDIFQVIEEIQKRGIDVYVLSNGILIDRDRAMRLCGLGVKGVQVSIEGPEEIHEAIRGKGSFSRALKGVACLLDAGMTVTLNVTLSSINAHHCTDIVALASSMGVQRLGFSRLVPSGRGLDLLGKMLSPAETRKLYEKILSMQVEGLAIVSGDPVASQVADPSDGGDSGDVPLGGCAAGVSGLTFLPDGTITPCRRLAIPIGNVLHDSLREVWATSEVLESLRDRSRYKGKCGTCRRWARCRGCRAIAYAYTQARGTPDFLAEDPQCFL